MNMHKKLYTINSFEANVDYKIIAPFLFDRHSAVVEPHLTVAVAGDFAGGPLVGDLDVLGPVGDAPAVEHFERAVGANAREQSATKEINIDSNNTIQTLLANNV